MKSTSLLKFTWLVNSFSIEAFLPDSHPETPWRFGHYVYREMPDRTCWPIRALIQSGLKYRNPRVLPFQNPLRWNFGSGFWKPGGLETSKLRRSIRVAAVFAAANHPKRSHRGAILLLAKGPFWVEMFGFIVRSQQIGFRYSPSHRDCAVGTVRLNWVILAEIGKARFKVQIGGLP